MSLGKSGMGSVVVLETGTEGVVPEREVLVHGSPIMGNGCLVRPPEHVQEQQLFTGERATYSIFHVTHNNLTPRLISEMVALQDQICGIQAPDPTNPLDYKTMDEFEAHFQQGHDALIIVVNDQLVGTCLLSSQQEDSITAAFLEANGVEGAPNALKVGFLAIDPVFRKNMLANSLLAQAEVMAEQQGKDALIAGARLWNKGALKRFSESGFVGVSVGENAKDGSLVLSMARAVNDRPHFDTIRGWNKLMNDPLDRVDELQGDLSKGNVAYWHQAGDALAIYPLAEST